MSSVTFLKGRYYISLFKDIWKFAFIYTKIENVTSVVRKKISILFENLYRNFITLSSFTHAEVFISLNRSSLTPTYGTKYSSMYRVKFVEDSLWKVWSDMVYLSCLPHISLRPFLNILSHIKIETFTHWWH